MKTYTYDRTDQPGQYQLTLTDTGESVDGKPRVSYWLRNVDSLVHSLFEGEDLFVAPGQDPEGPESASDVLSFYLAAEAEAGRDWYYQLEEWESILSEEAESLREVD